jgi:hypothetical protein
LKHLSKTGTVAAANQQAPAPDTMSTRAAAPPTASPPALEVTSATSDDACKRDEERLAKLRAKPSRDEAVHFEEELNCSRLQPQVLALFDTLSQSPQSAGAPTPTVAPTSTTSARATPTALAPPSETNSAEGAPSPDGALPNPRSTGETAHPGLEPPATEATPAASTDACKQDAERLTRLRTNPSSEEATRFAQELRCETLRPELLALSGELANPPPTQIDGISNEARGARNAVNDAQPPSQAIADAERRIVALESDKEALAAEVSKLQHDREATSAEQAATPSPQPASPAERSEAEAASQAAADAERRIAELESEKVALTAEVNKLQRDREASSADQTKPIPPPPPAVPAERSNAEPAAALASLPEGMPARVLIRYLKNNADARAQAEKLASALAAQDVEVTDVRESRTAIRTELSFSYAPDETIARRVGRIVGVSAVRRLQPKDGLMVRPGTVELTLSGDSHLAVIKTTSTRESNHE